MPSVGIFSRFRGRAGGRRGVFKGGGFPWFHGLAGSFLLALPAWCGEILPGDLLWISIRNVPQGERERFEGWYKVDPEGRLNLPMVGFVAAADRSPKRLTRELEKLYNQRFEIYARSRFEVAPAAGAQVPGRKG